jgi:hypothetical protein
LLVTAVKRANFEKRSSFGVPPKQGMLVNSMGWLETNIQAEQRENSPEQRTNSRF